jgi:hypothetical protein
MHLQMTICLEYETETVKCTFHDKSSNIFFFDWKTARETPVVQKFD